MNSPAVPPSNPDRFTVGDVEQLDFPKCKSRTEHCAHESVIDDDREFVENTGGYQHEDRDEATQPFTRSGRDDNTRDESYYD